MFSNAPTERGLKHINEFIKAKSEGFNYIIDFVIQMEGIEEVRGNRLTHPEFADALEKARENGAEILFLKCKVETDALNIIAD